MGLPLTTVYIYTKYQYIHTDSTKLEFLCQIYVIQEREEYHP